MVDLTGDYIKYYHASEQLSDQQKIEYFDTMVFQKAPCVYERIFNDIKWIGEIPEERIIDSHAGFKSIKGKYAGLSDTLVLQLSASLRLFQETFPDFHVGFDVYVLHSLGIRAGGVVHIEGKDVFMIGVEQIIKYFDLQNFSPFFHHEFTHLYHNQYYTPNQHGNYSADALYNHLWTEGLAVYISKVLNPHAGQKEVFFTGWSFAGDRESDGDRHT